MSQPLGPSTLQPSGRIQKEMGSLTSTGNLLWNTCPASDASSGGLRGLQDPVALPEGASRSGEEL